MNNNVAPPNQPRGPQTEPLSLESRYTKFYLTMLILSTIGTLSGVLNIVTLPQVLDQLQSNQFSSVLSLINILVVFPASVIALVLLWQKRIFGLWIKLSAYAISLIIIGLGFITIDETISKAVKLATKDLAGDNATQQFATTFTSATIYISIVLAVVTSITFGILWWFAWKNQAAADADQQQS